MRRRPRKHRWWHLALVLASLPLLSPLAPSQNRRLKSEVNPLEYSSSNPLSFAVGDSREVRELLLDAENHFSAGRWAHGLKLLQKIIEERPNDVYLPGRDSRDGNSSRTYIGSANYAEERILALPESAREIYHANYGRLAAAGLEESLRKRDVPTLEKIVQRYGMSREGLQALRILGDIALEQGNLLGAEKYFRTLLARSGPDAETLLRLGSVLHQLGNRGDLEELIHGAEGEVTFRGQKRPIAEVLSNWLQDTSPAPPATTEFSGYQAFRSPHLSPDPTGLEPVAWNFPEEPQSLRRPFQKRGRGIYTPSFNFHPSVAQGVVFTTDSISAYAIDLFSGKQRWRYPGSPGWTRMSDRERQEFYKGINPNYSVSGSTSQGIYIVPLQVPLKLHGNESIQGIPIRTIIPTRRLFAFDGETGKILWSHWRPGLARLGLGKWTDQTNIAAPPIISGDRIYVPVYRMEGKIDYYIACFSLHTGELQWKTPIVSGQLELNMFGRQIQEFAGAPILLHKGDIYFSTNLGVMGSVEASSGRLRWLTIYDTIPIPKAEGYNRRPRTFHWANQPPVMGDGHLFITPLDSDRLYAVQPESGEILLWHRYDADGTRLRHLLGMADGKLYLYGTRLIALEPNIGREIRRFRTLWEKPILPNQIQSPKHLPRGILTERSIIVPGTEGLETFSLINGNPMRELVPWDSAQRDLGNLVLDRGILLSQSSRTIQARFDWKKLLRKARRLSADQQPQSLEHLGRLLRRYADSLLREKGTRGMEVIQAYRESAQILEKLQALGNPDAPSELSELYLSIGEIQAERKNHPEAELAYRKAFEKAPTAEERLLTLLQLSSFLEEIGSRDAFQVTLARLEQGFADKVRNIPGVGRIPIGLHVQLKRYKLSLASRGPVTAVELLQGILSRYGNVELLEGTAHDFSRKEIARLIRLHGREIYAPYEAEAEEHLQRSMTARDPGDFFELIHLYPNSRIVVQAYRQLADLFLAEQDPAALADLCHRFLTSEVPPEARAAMQRRMAAAFAAKGSKHLAAGMLQFLSRSFAGLVSDYPEDAEKTYAELAFPESSVQPLAGPKPPLSRGERVRMAHTSLSMLQPQGDDPGQRGFVLLAADGELRCYRPGDDDSFNRPVWNLRLDPEDRFNPITALAGDTLIIAAGRTIQGVDLPTGKIRWTRPIESPFLEAHYRNGLLVYTFQNKKGSFACTAVDIVNGIILWTNILSGEFVPQIIMGSSHVAFLPTGIQETSIEIIQLYTGQLVRTVEPPDLARVISAAISEGTLILAYPPTDLDGTGKPAQASLLGYPLFDGERPAWKARFPGSLEIHTFLTYRDRLYVMLFSRSPQGRDGGAIYEVQSEKGGANYLTTLPGEVMIPGIGLYTHYSNSVDEGQILLLHPDSKGFLRAIFYDLVEAKVVWKRSLPVPVNRIAEREEFPAPVFTEDLLFLPLAVKRGNARSLARRSEVMVLQRSTGETADTTFALGETLDRKETRLLSLPRTLLVQQGLDIREFRQRKEGK